MGLFTVLLSNPKVTNMKNTAGNSANSRDESDTKMLKCWHVSVNLWKWVHSTVKLPSSTCEENPVQQNAFVTIHCRSERLWDCSLASTPIKKRNLSQDKCRHLKICKISFHWVAFKTLQILAFSLAAVFQVQNIHCNAIFMHRQSPPSSSSKWVGETD